MALRGMSVLSSPCHVAGGTLLRDVGEAVAVGGDHGDAIPA